MNCNSDINLRSHLAYIHGRHDVLTDGQKKRNGKNDLTNQTCSPVEKKTIDEAVIECIYNDSRPFNDFTKPGMRGLFKILKPQYKTLTRNKIKKRMKIK